MLLIFAAGWSLVTAMFVLNCIFYTLISTQVIGLRSLCFISNRVFTDAILIVRKMKLEKLHILLTVFSIISPSVRNRCCPIYCRRNSYTVNQHLVIRHLIGDGMSFHINAIPACNDGIYIFIAFYFDIFGNCQLFMWCDFRLRISCQSTIIIPPGTIRYFLANIFRFYGGWVFDLIYRISVQFISFLFS